MAALAKIRTRYEKYMKDVVNDRNVKDIISDWENGRSDNFVDQQGFKFYPGTLGATINGKPVFQVFLEKNTIVRICENQEHVAFIPAGFNRGKDQSKTLTDADIDSLTVRSDSATSVINPIQHRFAGNSALMSLLHVLVIPKQRIFNAVTLRNKGYNYSSAQALGRQALQMLKDAPSDTAGSLSFWLKDGKLKAREEDMASNCALPEDAEMHSIDHKYSFHVYGDNSIGYLHMHVYDGSLLTKAYEEMGGNKKNTDVNAVKQWASESQLRF